MTRDPDRADAAAPAIADLRPHDRDRVWKAIAREIGDRLFEKGLAANPKNRANPPALTRDGIARDSGGPERSADAPSTAPFGHLPPPTPPGCSPGRPSAPPAGAASA